MVEAFEADQKQALEKAGISVTDMSEYTSTPSQEMYWRCGYYTFQQIFSNL